MESELDLLKLKVQYPEQFITEPASTYPDRRLPELIEETSDADFQPEWTDDSIKLLELALSVHRARSLNHGKASITAVVNFFFKLFGLKPGNFFSTYGVMRIRSGSRTKYLDELKAGLEEKMDEDDEKSEKRLRK